MPTLPGDSTLAGPHGARVPGKAASTAGSEASRQACRRSRRPRRPIGSAVMHAPQVLRALVRADEIWLVVLAAFLGCATGIVVWLMTATTQLDPRNAVRHRRDRTAQRDGARSIRCAPCWCPAFGGLVLGLLTLGIARFRPRRTVDPIEANALFGGRMSLNGSLIVVLQTIMSNGVGASVGLEAGLHPDRIGDRLPLGPRVPGPAQRSAAAGRLRRGRGDRRRVQCAADRRVLCVRTGDRHLYSGVVRAGRGRRPGVAGGGARAGRLDLRPGAAGARPYRAARLHPDPRAGHAVRAAGHLHHARRDGHRGAVPQERRAGLAAAGDRRPGDRHAGAGHAGGAVVRPWRAGPDVRGA